MVDWTTLLSNGCTREQQMVDGTALSNGGTWDQQMVDGTALFQRLHMWEQQMVD